MAFWYVRKSNELLIDLDGKNAKSHAARLLKSRKRIYGAKESGKLDIRTVWFYPSGSEMHHHVIVALGHDISYIHAVAWEMHFGSDIYRSCNNLMRATDPTIIGYNSAAFDLLITPQPYPGFYRPPDFNCLCEGKHTLDVMEKCPAAKIVRGSARTTDYLSPRAEKPPRWREYGRVL